MSTDISYKYGETGQGIQFPLITLCNWRLKLKECYDYDESLNFISILASCLKNNKTSQMRNLHPEIRNIVETVKLHTGLENVNLDQFYGKVWTKVFHQDRGPCYTFDVSKIDKFKYVSLTGHHSPFITFVMAENNPWKDTALVLHTRFDLPDAFQLNGLLALSFLNKVYKYHVVEFRKKISKKETTRKAPCVKHEYNTCKSIEDNRVIFERFHCIVPILYTGPHLDDLISKEATNCSHYVTLEALNFTFTGKESNCSMTQTCENVRFTTKYTTEETWSENKSSVFVMLENPEVQYHHSYISYDLFSLIGEIGGILGITLGASALTLFELQYILSNGQKLS